MLFRSGPDILWALGNHVYAVIEAKTGAQGDAIFKKDINQLAGSVNWCRKQYGPDAVIIPVMVHRKSIIERTGTPPGGTRILDAKGVEALKKAIAGFLVALGDDLKDSAIVSTRLNEHGLTIDEIFSTNSAYFKNPRIQR